MQPSMEPIGLPPTSLGLLSRAPLSCLLKEGVLGD